MGLESHIKAVLQEYNFEKYDYEIVRKGSEVRLFSTKRDIYETNNDRHVKRDSMFAVLKESGDFNPKKLGKYWIVFKPVSQLWKKYCCAYCGAPVIASDGNPTKEVILEYPCKNCGRVLHGRRDYDIE